MFCLIGMAEAGLFPGVLLYMTYWYTPLERGSKMALFYMAQVRTLAVPFALFSSS